MPLDRGTSLRLPPELLALIDKAAGADQRKRSAWIRLALEYALENMPPDWRPRPPSA